MYASVRALAALILGGYASLVAAHLRADSLAPLYPVDGAARAFLSAPPLVALLALIATLLCGELRK